MAMKGNTLAAVNKRVIRAPADSESAGAGDAEPRDSRNRGARCPSTHGGLGRRQRGLGALYAWTDTRWGLWNCSAEVSAKSFRNLLSRPCSDANNVPIKFKASKSTNSRPKR